VEMGSGSLTHMDENGNARMVDVTDKPPTERSAVARGRVLMRPETIRLIQTGSIPKGDVFSVARVAAVMAAKRTADIIPMCHPLSITAVEVSFAGDPGRGVIDIEARVKAWGKTGVEMEALTAVSAAALTIYDMCKAVDKDMTLTDIRLVAKTGGRSGTYRRGGE